MKNLYYYLLGYKWTTVHTVKYYLNNLHYYTSDLELLIKTKESKQLYNPIFLVVAKGYRVNNHDPLLFSRTFRKKYLSRTSFLKYIIDLQKTC